ncbi:MAG: citrate/2-methylcitrate synthase [Pirellulaceae bacterium]
MGLTYLGYSIEDLAAHAEFEEVAFLLLYGHLPTRDELMQFKARLASARSIPPSLKSVLEQLPGSAHPMDVLRTGCSALGVLEPEVDFADQHRAAERLLACMPSLLVYWYHFQTSGRRIEVESGCRFHRGSLSAFAAWSARQQATSAGDACHYDFVCRTRVQRLDLCRLRINSLDTLRLSFSDYCGHWCVAWPVAWRSQLRPPWS